MHSSSRSRLGDGFACLCNGIVAALLIATFPRVSCTRIGLVSLSLCINESLFEPLSFSLSCGCLLDLSQQRSVHSISCSLRLVCPGHSCCSCCLLPVYLRLSNGGLLLGGCGPPLSCGESRLGGCGPPLSCGESLLNWCRSVPGACSAALPALAALADFFEFDLS